MGDDRDNFDRDDRYEREKLKNEILIEMNQSRDRRFSTWMTFIGIALTSFVAFFPLLQSPSPTSDEKVSIVQYIYILITSGSGGDSNATPTPVLSASETAFSVTQTAFSVTKEAETPTSTPEAEIATSAPTITLQPTERPVAATETPFVSSGGCFCTVYADPSDPFSGCPGTAIRAGESLPPSSILQPSNNPSQLLVYINGGQAETGGLWWEYRTEMNGGGQPASQACIEDQYQYFPERTPVQR